MVWCGASSIMMQWQETMQSGEKPSWLLLSTAVQCGTKHAHTHVHAHTHTAFQHTPNKQTGPLWYHSLLLYCALPNLRISLCTGWGAMSVHLHANAMLCNMTFIKLRLQYIYPVLLDALIWYSTMLCMCQYQIRLGRDMCYRVVVAFTSRYYSVVDCDVSYHVKLETTQGIDGLVWAEWCQVFKERVGS